TRTGMALSDSLSRSRPRTAGAFMSGRWKSRTTKAGRGASTNGGRRSRNASALPPSSTVWTVNRSSRMALAARRNPGLSSTTRTAMRPRSPTTVSVLRGQPDVEATAGARCRRDGDGPPVRLDDAADDREPDARAAHLLPVDLLLAPRHAAEQLEDHAVVRLVDPDAVVAHGEDDIAVVRGARDGDLAAPGRHVFHRVAQQIAEHAAELLRIGEHARQLPHQDARPLGGDLRSERLQRVRDQRADIDPRRRLGQRRDPEELEQVADHVL